MEFRRDDRGVTVQIGAVLLFGILIIALATAQVTVVPDENEATEFEHSLEVQESVGELRNAILAAGRSGDPAAASIPLGTTYEQRTFFVNPPPASGTIRTVGTGERWANVSLTGANGDSEYENANEYWNGTTRTYDTGSIVYTPSYTRYDEAPTTVYENSLVANVFSEDRTLERTGQTLIRGNRINLLTVNGTLQENGVTSESVDARPLSAYTNTVTVKSTASDPLWINITSRLDANAWLDIGNSTGVLYEQRVGAGGNVAQVVEIGTTNQGGVTYHRIGIRLKTGTYELRGSSVAVGAVSEENKQPKPTYLVVTDGYDEVANGSTGTVTVQVRDQFNNPVDGFEVNGTLSTDYFQFVDKDGNEVDSLSLVTDEDGKATFEYNAVNETTGSQTAWLNFGIKQGSKDYEFVNESGVVINEFDFGDGDDGSESGGGEINPGSDGDLIQDESVLNGNDAEVTFNSTVDTQVNITGMRLNFYYYSGGPGRGGGGEDPPTQVNELGADGVVRATNIEIGSGYRTFSNPVEIASGGETVLTLTYDGTPEDDDFFVITLVFEYGGQTYRSTYFVGLQ